MTGTRYPRSMDLMPLDGPLLVTVARMVAAQPLAATVLSLLLRTGEGRTVPEGLVAESTAYGLLQAGPEFARWRASRPVRARASADGPPPGELGPGLQEPV